MDVPASFAIWAKVVRMRGAKEEASSSLVRVGPAAIADAAVSAAGMASGCQESVPAASARAGERKEEQAAEEQDHRAHDRRVPSPCCTPHRGPRNRSFEIARGPGRRPPEPGKRSRCVTCHPGLDEVANGPLREGRNDGESREKDEQGRQDPRRPRGLPEAGAGAGNRRSGEHEIPRITPMSSKTNAVRSTPRKES